VRTPEIADSVAIVALVTEPDALAFCAARLALPNPSIFVLHLFRVEFHPSARRHGVADEDIIHAMRLRSSTRDELFGDGSQ
jgi:hypothetical protein